MEDISILGGYTYATGYGVHTAHGVVPPQRYTDHGMMYSRDSTYIWIGTQIRTTRYGATGPEIWCHMT